MFSEWGLKMRSVQERNSNKIISDVENPASGAPRENYLRRDALVGCPRCADLLRRLSVQSFGRARRRSMGGRWPAIRSRAAIHLHGMRQAGCPPPHQRSLRRARSISVSTFGNMRVTTASIPAAVGCRPSACLS